MNIVYLPSVFFPLIPPKYNTSLVSSKPSMYNDFEIK